MAIKAVHAKMIGGERYDCDVIMADVIRTEDKFNTTFGGLGDNVPVKMLAFLGYAAIKRAREVDGSFDEFWPQIDDMDFETDDDEDEAGGPGEA